MAITIHGPEEIARMRAAGRCAAATLAAVGSRLEAGVSTLEIDAWVCADTRARGARPSQLGYRGFAHAVCTSINEVVCHGMPSFRVLREGDIVNVDVTSELNGFHGDTSVTFAIGRIDSDAAHVIDVARRCLAAGIAEVRPGARIGDIGAAIAALAAANGCQVVREFGGHGIGRRMHMPPHVPHVGRSGTGPRLRPGMTFTIEPMVTLGDAEVRVLGDGWTVVTIDGTWSAQFEHTVLVTEDGVEVLTDAPHVAASSLPTSADPAPVGRSGICP